MRRAANDLRGRRQVGFSQTPLHPVRQGFPLDPFKRPYSCILRPRRTRRATTEGLIRLLFIKYFGREVYWTKEFIFRQENCVCHNHAPRMVMALGTRR